MRQILNQRKSFHLLCLIFAVTFVTYLSAKGQQNDSIQFSWKGLHSLLVQYKKHPSAANAIRIYKFLPNDKSTVYSADTTGLDEAFWLANAEAWNVAHFAYAGKRYAVKLCFKFFTIADGAFSEDLDVILAKLIKINPRLFLEELKAHRYLFGNTLQNDFQNFGDAFVDASDEVLAREDHIHIRALQSVKDSALIHVRDELLKVYRGNN